MKIQHLNIHRQRGLSHKPSTMARATHHHTDPTSCFRPPLPPSLSPPNPQLYQAVLQEYQQTVKNFSDDVEDISIEEVLQRIGQHSSSSVVFIDTRSPEEQRISTIPGALLSVDEFLARKDELLLQAAAAAQARSAQASSSSSSADPNLTVGENIVGTCQNVPRPLSPSSSTLVVAVFCTIGYRSALAIQQLQNQSPQQSDDLIYSGDTGAGSLDIKRGYRIANLRGSLLGWAAAGLPLVVPPDTSSSSSSNSSSQQQQRQGSVLAGVDRHPPAAQQLHVYSKKFVHLSPSTLHPLYFKDATMKAVVEFVKSKWRGMFTPPS